jgi:penicillin amidase
MRFALGLGYVVLLLVVGLWFVGTHFMAGTIPNYTGSRSVKGVTATVTIDRDAYAVPHIHGATEADAYFGLGYAMAQDRLLQMEFFRRIGQGRMSEITGKKSLTLDAWSRTVGFWRIANELWTKAAPDTRAVLTAYTNGINAYIDGTTGSFGFGFDALGIRPRHWQPQECFLVARLMSWQMNFSYFTDAAFGDIALRLDSAHLHSLYPNYPADGATTLEGIGEQRTGMGDQKSAALKPVSLKTVASKAATPKPAAPKPLTPKAVAPKPSPKAAPNANAPRKTGALEIPTSVTRVLAQVATDLRSLGIVPALGGGSNAFAVGPQRTINRSAILENDAHLDLHSPASWYLAHISSDDGMNVAGFLVPGMPVFIAGRTESLSWGITNAMADESDFFIERQDSTHTPSFRVLKDSILVKDSLGGKTPHVVPLVIRMTSHGPVMSDLSPFALAGAFDPSLAIATRDTSTFGPSRVVSMMWNGEYALGDEAGGFIRMVHAKSAAQARTLLRDYATPCLNICFADRSGTIAYQYAGRLPKRSGSEERVLLPRDGANPTDQWLGFIGVADLPSSVNPPRGYLVSANNPATSSRAVAQGNNWEPSSRADRLSTLLDTARWVDTGWVRKAMVDIVSPYAANRVLPYLLALFPDNERHTIEADSTALFQIDSMRLAWKEDSIRRHSQVTDSALRVVLSADSLLTRTRHPTRDTSHIAALDPFIRQVLTYLRNWDGGMRTEEIAPTIYSLFLVRLIENTYRDELGPTHYSEFVFVNNVPIRSLLRILPDSTNVWWDDRGTRAIEPRDTIILRSFRESLRILARTFGRDMRTWQWGRLHTLTFDHPFASAGPLIAHLVNIDAGGMPGDPTTVLQGSYRMTQPFAMRIGPSMRLIADMQSDELLAVLPTGNSEAMFGDHYRDMVDLYKHGDLLHIPLHGTNPKWKRLELKPQ